jgi:hypothetical protein
MRFLSGSRGLGLLRESGAERFCDENEAVSVDPDGLDVGGERGSERDNVWVEREDLR